MTLVCQFFRINKRLPKYLTDRKLKTSAPFLFEIKRAKMDKIFNFLKGCFLVMGGPMNIISGMFLETNVRQFRNLSQNIAKVLKYFKC